jgi:excisionase family DNA binding protein
MLNDKMAYSIDEFAEVSNTCRDKLYVAIHKGQLKARRNGRRTLILKEEGQAYLDSLPTIDPTLPATKGHGAVKKALAA